MKTYGYWHNQAVDGKSVCNHYAHEIGGECGHPDLGVWTPLVKREPAAEGFDAAVRADAVWMAKLARGASWPLSMAHGVETAANRVIHAYGTDVDRQVAAMLRDGEQ